MRDAQAERPTMPSAVAADASPILVVDDDAKIVQLPHLFERFYRVEKSRDTALGGAGIGLAIVKRLVELGGGQVGAESAADHTRFWFSLPT
jgi:signal transduction histidine kinase